MEQPTEETQQIKKDTDVVPCVFIDVETTGFSPNKCRVIEVAAIRVENDVIVEKVVSFCKIDEPVPEFIAKLTGITDADLKEAPVFADIAPQLAKILEGALMVAHNARFDYSFIEAEFERCGMKFDVSAACTCEMVKALYPQLMNHKLETCIAHFKLSYEARHRAFDDALALFQMLLRIKADFPAESISKPKYIVRGA